MKNSPVKYWYLSVVVGVVVLSFAMAGASLIVLSARPVKSLTAAELDDIREAVFRYQFEHNASGQQELAKSYFLSVEDGKDPEDEFMKRFTDHLPSVKKFSQAKGEFKKDGDLDGLMFHIEAIKQIGPNKVEVSGGYYESGLSASGNTYTVERVKKKWIVTRDKMHWIS